MATIGSLRQIVDYLKKNISKGYTMESLKWALIKQGYSRSLIEKAIEVTNQELAEAAPKLVEKPTIKYELLDEDYKPISFSASWWRKLKNWFG